MANIQVRNVPADVHRALKEQAARRGMSLSDYLRDELRDLAETPPLEDLFARVREAGLHEFSESSADIIRRDRDSR